jgi:hypothetical protein
MQSVILLNAFMQSVILLNVGAPKKGGGQVSDLPEQN